MNATRYIYKTVPLSVEDAIDARSDELIRIHAEIAELEKQADELIRSDLPTTRQVQIELNPGDDGYEDAPIRFNPVQYQGNVTWKNIENSTPPKPE